MYLKRLEIQGFKSFADGVEIELGPGITVIVGPNGCGKSNLTEAVQWVLGEQSARALRGYRMEDVIFSGTSRRRTHGMAEVSLTFDNTSQILPLAYEEVRITRRVYRSGESEYFINKTPCRLRDIQELFLSCGIGRAAFSIIAQGKIDEFLFMRPDERRVYLEEAAGVGKYRRRKADALQKLGETEQSLIRIRDLLGELERRRTPLAEQARIANLYNLYKNNRRQLELRLLEGQLCRIREKRNQVFTSQQTIQATLAQEQQRIAGLENEIKELENGLRERKKRIAHLEQEVDGIQKIKQEASIARVRAEEKLVSCSLRKRELESRLQGIEQKVSGSVAELHELGEACDRCVQQKKQIEAEIGMMEKGKEDWEKQKSRSDSDLEAHHLKVFDILHKKTALNSEIQGINNKRELLLRHQEDLKEKETAGNRRMQDLQEQIQRLDVLHSQQISSLEETLQECNDLRTCLDGLYKERQEVTTGIREHIQEFEGKQMRLRILLEAEEKKEGYQRGVREILKATAEGHASCQGIIGLVEDLLSSEARYEKALYVALGQAGQYLVCNTPEAAQSAIGYLKSRGTGRASFLPLTALDRWVKKGNRIRHYSDSEIIGHAADLVTCAHQYRNLADFLLGRTLVAKDIKTARIFAERHDYRVRVVTLDGDLLQPGGLITGGHITTSVTSRRRKQELAQLKTSLVKHQEALADLREQDQRLFDRIDAAAAKLKELEESVRRKERAKEQSGEQLTSLRLEIKQLTDFTQDFFLAGEEQGFHRDDLEPELRRLEQELAAIVEIEESLKAKRTGLDDHKKHCEKMLQDIQNRLVARRIELVSMQQEERHLFQKRDQIRVLTGQNDREREEIASGLKVLGAEMEALEAQKKCAYDQFVEFSGKEEISHRELTLRKQRAAAAERYYLAREKRTLKLKQIAWQHQQQVRHWELQDKHLGEQMEQIFARAQEMNIPLGPDTLVRELGRGEEAQIENKIKDYQEKLAAIGEVNFAAPFEFNELHERCDFLQQQEEDLREGKTTLCRVIKEMDEIVAGRFQKTYRTVRQNFENLFAALCEGGKAELLLTDESNLLETGLDVVVTPRGKKPRHLTLLSGGEKALTGIAFLFALLRTNPNPFYLLDEIEAALDEANLSRFSEFLKEMGEQSQLILISHRYQTMLVADTLYGVTMEEPGVSKLVSVQLSDWEQLPHAAG